MNKNVIYTCIIGNYDSLKPIKFRVPGFDYVCYTDGNISSNEWEMRTIPDNIKNLSQIRQNRYIKWHPYELFPEYEFSVYIDASMTSIGDVNELKNFEKPITLIQHPNRHCTYQEFLQCAKQDKDDINNLYEQMQFYFNEGFPMHFGLTHNTILIRHHNDPKCIEIDNKVWEIISKYSHRDQLAIMYVLWKTNSYSSVHIIKPQEINSYFNYFMGGYHDLAMSHKLELEIDRAKSLIGELPENNKQKLIRKYVLNKQWPPK